MTKLEACQKWVREFNAIPFEVVRKLQKASRYSDFCEVTIRNDEEEVYGDLPMWGTLWSFGDSCDDWWLEERDGIKKMSECGFRIYESEDWGYVFGIDGAGYDFYEAHWLPLYDARGLQWHERTA